MSEPPLDLLWGAKAIAAELGVPVRKTFYLLEKHMIPATKIGRAWVCERDALRRRVHAPDASQ